VTAHVTPPPSLPAPAPKAADSVVFEKTSHHEQLSPQASPAPAPAPSHTSIAVTLDTTAATSDSGYLSPKEGFVTRYGYNWDWVLVFPVEPPQGKTSPTLHSAPASYTAVALYVRSQITESQTVRDRPQTEQRGTCDILVL
jgi:hypothetical protein